ncbi:hypothetical protein SAMN02745166_01709 [Prosthecobacter debontii]|uniref:DUF4185 domain-containing protein n=1 Tax=Prosthecobacter debontii TaxID=48467 RepID=A0A1T4XLS2_9BACT|nr:hypothetical protein [Prosthecobacter debontii]SKA90477.1 hypothetical protein SAMN02745166_01709 [Prosthecobacter debontii]
MSMNTKALNPIISGCCLVFWLMLSSASAQPEGVNYFGIHIVDQETGRGVPLITLTSVNHQSWVTDSNGWIAFHEPGLMNTDVFLYLQSPGYSVPKDGFGYAGVRLKPQLGQTVELKVRRDNIAERLYRITGQGIYRDSLLLGQSLALPHASQTAPNLVLGQDSVQVVPWRGRLFWLWGDTNVPHYPLGNFRSTCAWSQLPMQGGLAPQDGVALDYLKMPDGKLRPMMPSEQPGMIWIFGLLNVTDERGNEHLVGHYGRFKSLTKRVEHGLTEFDESLGHFRAVKKLEPQVWQHPEGNAMRVERPEGSYFYFTESFPVLRVRADYDSVLTPSAYEALAWSEGEKTFVWQSAQPPLTQQKEAQLVRSGHIRGDQACFQVNDADSGKPVIIHRSSVQWNDYRQRWIMIATQSGGTVSQLGEVWYAESIAPEGPWKKAVKIASHPRYSFYNPRQHPFFDQQGGRIVYFEGTYTETFSGNPVPTPRYDYNQLMYRLDLADPRLAACHE